MKQIKIAIVVTLVLTSFQCSRHDDPNPKDNMIKQLTADMWTTDSVESEADGDVTQDYANFAIAFNHRPDDGFDGDYYVAGGGRAFPELVGQWKLGDDLSTLILANGREMEVTLTETTLTLVFTAVPPGGRVSGLSGRFTFRLKKK